MLWRSLEEQPEYRSTAGPAVASAIPGRRDFLKLAAASLALAAGACSPPAEEITPYVRSTGAADPGVPRFFATAMSLGGSATGLLVESNMGRPTKVEGNPAHPSSLGATDVYAQAAVLQLWDPDRARTIRRGDAIASRDAFDSTLAAKMAELGKRRGQGLRILTRYVDSPALAAQLRELIRRYPAAVWHTWEPLHRDHALAGARLAFGRELEPVYRFDRAAVVVALDADFLGAGPGHLRHARDFSARRRSGADGGAMNRLYVVESAPSLAGAAADHRFALSVADMGKWLGELAAALGEAPDRPRPAIEAIARDLQAHPGACVIVAGDSLPPPAHALVHALNRKLGAADATVYYIEPPGAQPGCTGSIRDLVADVRAGAVDTLVMLGGNPAYDAPGDLDFPQALRRVPLAVHLSLYEDETAALSTWHVPQAHFLEQWSDARGHDGTASIVQPLIAPLHGGVSAHELLALLQGEAGATAHDIVRAHWKGTVREAEFPELWETALREGIVRGTASSPVATAVRRQPYEPTASAPGWSVRFCADPSVRDGDFANNAWLQELPRPDSKLTWDNAALVAPASAHALGVRSGDIVELRAAARTVRAPVWVLPGQAEGVIAIALGYGRSRAGRVGNGVGCDAYPLRGAGSPWEIRDIRVRKIGEGYPFATTQAHGRMEGREPVRHATLAEYRAGQGAPHERAERGSLYPKWPYEGYRWGMAIDLGACIGCNACTVACQAENNIPTVGKAEVARGREMHWIRVDRYYDGDAVSPRVLYQPVPCMHCENAPCEEVCPVGATVHDSDGLNVQVYNRCVGTRFCSNNCPYKVRRFNFRAYADRDTEELKAARNPQVTVRMRGVMEKCSYCIQRVTRARIATEKEGRRISDGEVLTACQAACPTAAIVFGDMNDEASRVNRLKRSPLNYALLEELNTAPRTTYLARLFNPNPELAGR